MLVSVNEINDVIYRVTARIKYYIPIQNKFWLSSTVRYGCRFSFRILAKNWSISKISYTISITDLSQVEC